MCECELASKEKTKRCIRAYTTYLNAIKHEHEQSFLQDDIDSPSSPEDLQLAIAAEIEIVEDQLRELHKRT
jgi:hypothetical protein